MLNIAGFAKSLFAKAKAQAKADISNDPLCRPGEDITGEGEEYYPIVGEEYQPPHNNTGVPEDVAAITELKQEASALVRARVIEFKVKGRTFTRLVHKADKAAFERIKADIWQEVEHPEGDFRGEDLREILLSLKVRPGFVYA